MALDRRRARRADRAKTCPRAQLEADLDVLDWERVAAWACRKGTPHYHWRK